MPIVGQTTLNHKQGVATVGCVCCSCSCSCCCCSCCCSSAVLLGSRHLCTSPFRGSRRSFLLPPRCNTRFPAVAAAAAADDADAVAGVFVVLACFCCSSTAPLLFPASSRITVFRARAVASYYPRGATWDLRRRGRRRERRRERRWPLLVHPAHPPAQTPIAIFSSHRLFQQLPGCVKQLYLRMLLRQCQLRLEFLLLDGRSTFLLFLLVRR